MLRSALRHRKIGRLAELLKLPRYAAVGLIECLWHLAAVQAPRGDIGKLTDQEIAEGVFWPKRNAKHLIDCLSSDHVRLIDRCTCHRLRVHDWYDHSDQSVKKTVAKDPRGFLSCYLVKVNSGTVPESHRNDSSLPEPVPERLPVPEPVPVSGDDIDQERIELDREEMAVLSTLISLQASGQDVQAICDQIGRDTRRTPFNAIRALTGGKTGIPRTPEGLTVRRMLNDALEAHQRAQERPNISDSNRETLENLKRAGDRIRARQEAQQKPREITG